MEELTERVVKTAWLVVFAALSLYYYVAGETALAFGLLAVAVVFEVLSVVRSAVESRRSGDP